MEKLFQDFTPNENLWKLQVEKELKGANYDTLVWEIEDNITQEPLYTQAQLALNKAKIESIQASQKKRQQQSWRIAADANITKLGNKEIMNVLHGGVENLLLGHNNNELETVLKLVRPDYIQIAYDGSSEGLTKLSSWIEQQGEEIAKASHLSVYSDPVSEAILKNTTPNYLQTSNTAIGTFKPFSLRADYFAEMALPATWQLAFALYSVKQYAENLNHKDFLANLDVVLGYGTQFYIDIAKFRALRHLLSQLYTAYGVENNFELHAKESAVYYTQKDRFNNILRSSTGSMSAVLGGADVVINRVHGINAEESLDFSLRIAKNIQILLKEESYLDRVIDPAAGSYYLEELTLKMVEKAWDNFLSIETLSIAEVHERLNTLKNDAQAHLKTKYTANEATLLGVNKYPNGIENAVESSNTNVFALQQEALMFNLEKALS